MEPIDAAVREARECDNPVLSVIAKKHGVCRSTLSRRLNASAKSRAKKHVEQQLLSPQQEKSLVEYINRLTERGIPPTPMMVRTFAGGIAGKEPGKQWCQRFCKRWKDTITCQYLIPMDVARRKADSHHHYSSYFQLLEEKMAKYDIQASNTYNMDEKGFSLGSLHKTRRVFTKSLYQSGQLLGHTQDGNREWITLIAGICDDGTALPPALIYKAAAENLMDS